MKKNQRYQEELDKISANELKCGKLEYHRDCRDLVERHCTYLKRWESLANQNAYCKGGVYAYMTDVMQVRACRQSDGRRMHCSEKITDNNPKAREAFEKAVLRECRDQGNKDCTQEDRDKLREDHIRNTIISLVVFGLVIAGVVVLSFWLASLSPRHDGEPEETRQENAVHMSRFQQQ